MYRKCLHPIFIAVTLACAGSQHDDAVATEQHAARERTTKVVKSEEKWREELTEEQFHILREKGTEPAFAGKYWQTKTPGVYVCAACGQRLFSSKSKFASGTGWPSFYEAISAESIETIADTSHGMVRTEIVCSRCGGHLGHVFNDGPRPTGLRFCVNSASLALQESAHAEEIPLENP